MKAMIFAAGLGTRLKPFTNHHPKAMAVVNGKPLIQRTIEFLQSHGIQDFVINVHHFPNQILDFLGENQNFGSNIQISYETDKVLETGGGLRKAQRFLEDDTFLVMNVDILTNINVAKLIESHQKSNAIASLAVTNRESSRKLLFDSENKLCGWKNLKTGEKIIENPDYKKELAFSGIHIIEPKIFQEFKHEGTFSIIKTYMDLMKTQILKAYDHTGDILLDVGKPESIEKAQELFA